MSGPKSRSSGGIVCVRGTLIAFNLFTLFAGVATLTVGLLLFFASRSDNSSMELIEEMTARPSEDPEMPHNKEFRGLSIVLIGLGTLVSLVSFLGCFGACINGKCLLMSYLICVGLILTLQFLISVFAIVYRQPMTRTLRDELINSIRHEYRPKTRLDVTWGLMHQTFSCCGVDGFSDWFGVDAWPSEHYVPDSCCMDALNTTDCGKEVDPTRWYKQGCIGSIQFTMMEKLHYLASTIIVLVFLQLYGIIASTLLYYHVKQQPKNPKPFKTYSYELARRST